MWLLITAPIAGLLHMFLAIGLLWLNIESRAAYIIGDSLIALAWIGSFVFLLAKNKPAKDKLSQAGQAKKSLHAPWPRLAAALTIALCIFALWSVRLSYGGPAYDGVMVSDISRERIVLPVFSDEWLYAGFARKAAERRDLPLFDPFGGAESGNALPGNFLLPYVAGISGMMISTGIDAVDQYYMYVFAFHLAFILALYAFIRSFGIGRAGALAGLVLFICLPESNLMPGIWIMLPAYVGLLFAMMGLTLANGMLDTGKDEGMDEAGSWQTRLMRAAGIIGIWANFALASLIYPPYLIFVFICFVLRSGQTKKKFAFTIAGAACAALLIAYIAGMRAGFSSAGFGGLAHAAWEMLVRPRVGAATEAVWSFIPAVFFIIAAIGLWIAMMRAELGLFQKKTLLFGAFGLGIMTEFVYLFDKEIILSHQRTVFLLWILMIVMASFSIDSAWKKLSKNKRLIMPLAYGPLVLIVAAICMVVSGAYQRIPAWKGVTADVDFLVGPVPSRPIMLSMLPRGFEDALVEKKGTFIADPYMSLAIGATTNLRPLSASPSFITLDGPTLAEFNGLKTCQEKGDFASKHALSFVIVHASAHVSADALAGCAGFAFDKNIGERYRLYDRI